MSEQARFESLVGLGLFQFRIAVDLFSLGVGLFQKTCNTDRAIKYRENGPLKFGIKNFPGRWVDLNEVQKIRLTLIHAYARVLLGCNLF